MTIISKATGALSLVSCIRDLHKTAVIYSNKEYMKTSSDRVISTSINTQKSDTISYKDAQRKNWHNQHDIFSPLHDVWGKVSGYVKGFVKSSTRYIPNFICSGFALLSSKKGIANVAAGLLAIIEGIDYVKNTYGIGQRDDYLK